MANFEKDHWQATRFFFFISMVPVIKEDLRFDFAIEGIIARSNGKGRRLSALFSTLLCHNSSSCLGLLLEISPFASPSKIVY